MEVCSPSQANTTPVMKTSVWKETPVHIVERTLAFLPVKDLLRMRSVCKAWSSDILSIAMFRKLHRECSPRQEPWFLVSTTKRIFLAYDVNTHKWNILSLSRLPDPDLRVLASSQGLVCYGFSSGEDVTVTDFYVSNPITGEWRHLPQHPEKTVDHFGMQYDENTDSYKILTMNVASIGGGIRRVTIYDSRLGQWTEGPVPRSTMHFSKSPMVWCGNRVYFMDKIRPFCELHAFDVEQSTWHELQTAAPQVLEYPSLVACKEQLFIVGLRSDDCKIFQVLDRQAGLELLEYDTLPKVLPNEFAVVKKASIGYGRCANYNSFRLTAVGSSSNLMAFSSNLDHTWVLIYDTKRKTFHESPKNVKHAAQLGDNVALSFQPCLDASP
jgi:hypothetical protein